MELIESGRFIQLRVMSWYSYEQVSPLAMQVWCFKVSDDFECYGRNHLKWDNQEIPSQHNFWMADKWLPSLCS